MARPPFQRLVDRHGAEVFRVLVALAGRERADDLFQETFLAALRAYERLDADADLRAWVLTIARHKVVDGWRGEARRPEARPEVDLGAAAAPAAPDELGLWAAVGELPPKQRAAVLLRYAGDLPYADIGAVVECSEAAARRNVFEGLRRLREGFAP